MTDCRIPETDEEFENLREKLLLATVEERDLFNRYLNKTLTPDEFLDKQGVQFFIRIGFFIPIVPSIKAIIRSYSQLGIIAEPLKGSCWHTSTMVAVNHDGVQYSIDDRGEYFKTNNKEKVEHSLHHLELLRTHYHERVKEVYDYLKTKTDDDIWVMAGGGSQLQAFFGNKDGYIAILYLDMDTYIKVGDTNATKARMIKTKDYTLSVQFEHNNHYFDDCTIENLEISKSDYVRT